MRSKERLSGSSFLPRRSKTSGPWS